MSARARRSARGRRSRPRSRSPAAPRSCSPPTSAASRARPRSTRSWAALRPSQLARTEVGAARVGDRIYVVGGFISTGGTTGKLERYDISADRWRRLRSLPIAVNHPGRHRARRPRLRARRQPRRRRRPRAQVQAPLPLQPVAATAGRGCPTRPSAARRPRPGRDRRQALRRGRLRRGRPAPADARDLRHRAPALDRGRRRCPPAATTSARRSSTARWWSRAAGPATSTAA